MPSLVFSRIEEDSEELHNSSKFARIGTEIVSGCWARGLLHVLVQFPPDAEARYGDRVLHGRDPLPARSRATPAIVDVGVGRSCVLITVRRHARPGCLSQGARRSLVNSDRGAMGMWITPPPRRLVRKWIVTAQGGRARLVLPSACGPTST